MKKIFGILVIMILLVPMSGQAALEDINDHSAGDKLSRGLLNMVASPVEIARSISVNTDKEGAGYGWTVGLIKGLGMTLVRFGAGVVETVTFPFDFPDENKAPLLDPEFPWQKWSGDYTS